MSRFRMDPDWLCYMPEPSIPSFQLPPGAVDTHCHVFGPGEVFPYADGRKYTPCDASKDQLFALRDRLGFARQVIVQASCHGMDNRAMLDALKSSGGRARGVASVAPDVTDAALLEMHRAGVRALRFILVRRLAQPLPDAQYRDLARRIAPLGWHCVFYMEQADVLERRDLLESMPIPVVLDHMARLGPQTDGSESSIAEFRLLLDDMSHLRVKVSGLYLLSGQPGSGYADMMPVVREIVEQYPDRVIWGSDWPHPNLKSHMPDDGRLVDLIPAFAPSPGAVQALLVDNPARLYFNDMPASSFR